jgi:hypothetical protein
MDDSRSRAPEPEIKREQEHYPPTRLDNPEIVATEEKRFGMSVPIMVGLITVLFIIVIIIYAV